MKGEFLKKIAPPVKFLFYKIFGVFFIIAGFFVAANLAWGAFISPDTAIDVADNSKGELVEGLSSEDLNIAGEGGLFLGMLSGFHKAVRGSISNTNMNIEAVLDNSCPAIECRSDGDCGAGKTCDSMTNVCLISCSNECSYVNQRKCELYGAYMSIFFCNDYNADGCLEWGNITPCPNGCSMQYAECIP